MPKHLKPRPSETSRVIKRQILAMAEREGDGIITCCKSTRV